MTICPRVSAGDGMYCELFPGFRNSPWYRSGDVASTSTQARASGRNAGRARDSRLRQRRAILLERVGRLGGQGSVFFQESPPNQEGAVSVRLFIGNLPYSATEADLREHLSSVGEPSQIVLPTDRET